MSENVIGVESAGLINLEIVEYRQRDHPGAPRIPPKRVNKVGERMMFIYRKTGGVDAKDVVADAENVLSSPLRPLILKHDDATAIHKWRLHLARSLIKSVNVVFSLPSGERIELPAFYNVRIDQNGVKKRTYLPVTMITSNMALEESAKSILRSQLMSLMRQLEKFEEFATIVDEIRKL